MHVRTLLTTANDCPNKWDCPSVHELDTDPDGRYLISKQASQAERETFTQLLASGEVVGWVPVGLLDECNGLLDRTRGVADQALLPGRRYVITTAVTDVSILALFGDLVGRGEQLGRISAHELAVI